jgi:hypothetical protein
MATWQLQIAKAKLSELLRAVREDGPQVISVRGKEEFVVSLKTGATTAAPRTGLDLFRPVLGLGDELEIPPRRVEERRAEWTEDDEEKQ